MSGGWRRNRIRPSVEPDPEDDGYPRMICLTLALESGKQLDQDKLQAIMRRRCGEGGLILVEPPK